MYESRACDWHIYGTHQCETPPSFTIKGIGEVTFCFKHKNLFLKRKVNRNINYKIEKLDAKLG
jgi:hypothetical protein